MGRATDGPVEGRRLGDFDILRELGRGGMGVVFEARQRSLNRKVALKVLASGLGLSERTVRRFRAEAEAAARLHHTNIVPVYATGDEDGVYYYAMELIEGPTLDSLIRQWRNDNTGGAPGLSATAAFVEGEANAASGSNVSPSTPVSERQEFDEAARMIAEVADALDYAHNHGVIHRDIKPSNLLRSPDGRLSINDFGLARLLEQPGMTVTGEFVGTPAYMSPEQITAGRVPIDHRTDVYSLGATLYELLTLRRPFTGERRDEVLAQIIHKDPITPRKVNPKVPLDLETICLKAMDKDPDRRYRSAGEMAADLRRYVNRFAIAARRAGPLERFRKWVRRHPALAGSLATVLLCAGFAGYFAFSAWRHQRLLAEAEARHERQLADEKRQAAFDRAYAAAMGGDFDGAERLLAEGELLGASTGEVRMLRGQIASHRGQSAEAVEHLRIAVELLPESVAARCLLANAYMAAGNEERFEQAMAEVDRLTPRTTEDLLFKAYAEAGGDPAKSLTMFEEAMRRRPSVVGYLMRSEILFLHATDLADLTRAEQAARAAVDDAEAAKRLLPGNVAALANCVLANMTVASIEGLRGNKEKRAESLARAEHAAQALESFAAQPEACVPLWLLRREAGTVDSVDGAFDRVHAATGNTVVGFCHVSSLYRQGRLADALKVLDRRRGHPLVEELRPVILADAEGVDQALDALRANDRLDGDGWNKLNGLMFLRALGRKEESLTRARELAAHPERFPLVSRAGYRQLLDYATDRITSDELLRRAAGSRHTLCFAHYYLALSSFAEGDRLAARKHLRDALETGAWTQRAYDMSWSMLGRAESDPSWPAWASR